MPSTEEASAPAPSYPPGELHKPSPKEYTTQEIMVAVERLRSQQQAQQAQPAKVSLGWKNWTGGGALISAIAGIMVFAVQEARDELAQGTAKQVQVQVMSEDDRRKLADDLAPKISKRVEATIDRKVDAAVVQLRAEADGERRLRKQKDEQQREDTEDLKRSLKGIETTVDNIKAAQDVHLWRHRQRGTPGTPATGP